MGIRANPNNQNFDFDGVLRLARQLWQLADAVGDVNGRRQASANEALVDFSGTYAEQFIERCSDERSSGDRVGQSLRDEAMLCARAWKDAMDEKNRRIHARHVDELKAERSALEKIGDFFTGFDAPARPNGVPTPVPPAFVATASPVRYS